MSILESLRNRMRPPARADDSPAADSQTLTDRYARLNERDAVTGLAQLSQVDLTAVEAFERSHRERPAVFNKLRYLRQREPVPGYDALEPRAIAEALSGSDTETIKCVREYESKLRNRPTALKAIDGALRASRGPAAPSGAATADVEQPLVVGNGLPVKVRPESGVDA